MRIGGRSVTAGAAFLAAIGIGHAMQFVERPSGTPGPAPVPALAEPATAAPRLPDDPALAPLGRPPGTALAARLSAHSPPAPVPAQPRFSPLGVACEITAEARPAADAQIAVALSAPCRPEAPVTFTHAGLRATERTDADGRLDLTLPALAVEAGVAFVFDDGARAEARSLIPGAVLRDRVALEWQGRTGLELHARENGAAHGAPGHVHAGAPEAGAGRFVRLGDADVPGAWLAEIYSHPRRDARASGAADVTVEARIGVANCGRTVTGRLLVPRGAEPAAPVALRLPIPGCEAIGDYLLLKTLSAGPTLAADQGR